MATVDVTAVLTRIEGGIGRITLNRPRSLNALTLGMVEAIRAALDAWAADPAVRFVLIDGAGERGLCAGGDIRALYDAALAGIASVNEAFFRGEYQLNGAIARFPKPYVALMDGLVMGGGVGVSAHGSHRVVTERSRIAMPETGIGFFPDIGATWLLSRAPWEFGTHMALTGEAIGADDAIRAGLADVHIASDRLPGLVEALRGCGASGLDACLRAFATPPAPGLFAEAQGWIAACYAGDDVQAIIAALAADGRPAALRAAAVIAGRSPTSLAITLRALRDAAVLDDLESCLDREFRMAVIRTRQHDFIEGVRAAVVDKDRKPRWMPARLDEVKPEDVAAFFAEAASHPPLWPVPGS
jgi:enoyl-CoA hydratase